MKNLQRGITAIILLFASACSLTAAAVSLPDAAVGWWSAEGNNEDRLGNGSTTSPGGAEFVPGFVGQAFSFTQGGRGVLVGNPAAFQIQNLTIEAWIKRADATQVSQTTIGGAALFAGGTGGYSLAIQPGGVLNFGKVAVSSVGSSTAVPVSGWHHVAVTKDGTAVQFYIDGVSAGTATYTPVFEFNTPFCVGSLGEAVGGVNYTFWGLIDEATLYRRALSSAEIGLIFGAGADGKNGEVINIDADALSRVRKGADFKARFSVKNNGLQASTNVLLSVSLPIGYTLVSASGSSGTTVVVADSVTNSAAVLPPGETVTLTLSGHGDILSDLAFHGHVSRDGVWPVPTADTADVIVSVVDPMADAPEGLVGWWRAEGDNRDAAGNGNLDVPGGAVFVTGKVGQAFGFQGQAPGVVVGAAAAFQLQDFTIEGWIKRASPTATSAQTTLAGTIFAGGPNSYGLALEPTGELSVSLIGVSKLSSTGQVVDTGWHHVAVTKVGASVVFYIDGANAGSGEYGPTFTFETPFAVGSLGAPFGANFTFLGGIDEVSLYNRALSGIEIGGIYAAGAVGKDYENVVVNASGPSAVLPGADYTVTFQVANAGLDVATNVVLNIVLPTGFTLVTDTASQGSNTLSGNMLQGLFGLILPGETATVTLTGHSASPTISIFGGLVTRDGHDVSLADNRANVSVEILKPCFPSPEGLLVLLKGEGNPDDSLAHATSSLDVDYGLGKVGQSLKFNGAAEVSVPESPDLDRTNFTAEAWIYPTAFHFGLSMIASKTLNYGIQNQFPPHQVYWYGITQFGLGLTAQGKLAFAFGVTNGAANEYALWTETQAVVPLNQWTHVAFTKTADIATVYVNGEVIQRLTGITSPPAINTQPIRVGYIEFTGSPGYPIQDFFTGLIDEFSYYSGALDDSEIAAIYQVGGAGKCLTAVLPTVLSGPVNQTVAAGQDASFGVTAVGPQPLTYQWKFKGNDIPGATNSTLTVPVVRQSAAGTYSVVVCNSAGCAPPVSATLTVAPVPAIISVVGTTASSLQNIEVPIRLIGNGVEHGISFTLGFDTNRLAYLDTSLGDDAADGLLLVNSSQAAKGILGISLVLSADAVFTKETNQVLRLSFGSALVTADAAVSLTFSDGVTLRKVSDAAGQVLPATWVNGTLTIKAAEFEGDVSPLPDGDRLLELADWVQVGRYAAGLDDLAAGAIFQRADCAPLATGGNGVITVSDWVQAGRFAAGLDPLSEAGGPVGPIVVIPVRKGPVTHSPAARVVSLGTASLVPGQTQEIPVTLTASGEENALGFTVSYDPAVLKFIGAVKGADGQKATLNVNTRQLAGGRAAVALTLSPGMQFPAGTLEVARLQLMAIGSGTNTAILSFTDAPVVSEVASSLATPLETAWQGASLSVLLPTVNARPVTTPEGPAIELSWPATSTGAVLETSNNLTGGSWTPVNATPTTANGQNTVVVPVSGAEAFFHLRLP